MSAHVPVDRMQENNGTRCAVNEMCPKGQTTRNCLTISRKEIQSVGKRRYQIVEISYASLLESNDLDV